MTAREKLCSFWGHKFEKLSSVPRVPSNDHPITMEELKERRNLPVLADANYYCGLFRTGLSNINLILGGEIDCCSGTSATRVAACANYNSAFYRRGRP